MHLISHDAVWPARAARPRPSAIQSIWRASDLATQPLHNSTRARAAQAQGPVQPGPIRRLSFGGWSLGAPHITLRGTGMTPSVASAAGGPKSHAVAHTTFGLPARPIRRAPLSDGRTASEGRG